MHGTLSEGELLLVGGKIVEIVLAYDHAEVVGRQGVVRYGAHHPRAGAHAVAFCAVGIGVWSFGESLRRPTIVAGSKGGWLQCALSPAGICIDVCHAAERSG